MALKVTRQSDPDGGTNYITFTDQDGGGAVEGNGSGGGQLQETGINLMVSMGQPVVGVVGSSADGVVLCSGLVCGGNTIPSNTDYSVYLPMIIKVEN